MSDGSEWSRSGEEPDRCPQQRGGGTWPEVALFRIHEEGGGTGVCVQIVLERQNVLGEKAADDAVLDDEASLRPFIFGAITCFPEDTVGQNVAGAWAPEPQTNFTLVKKPANDDVSGAAANDGQTVIAVENHVAHQHIAVSLAAIDGNPGARIKDAVTADQAVGGRIKQ